MYDTEAFYGMILLMILILLLIDTITTSNRTRKNDSDNYDIQAII